MKAAHLLLALLGSCAPLPPGPAGGDPAEPLDLLSQADPLRREEGAYRLSIQGGVLPEAILGRPEALAYAADDTARMRERLAPALEERDPQRMIWRAYHVLRSGCLAREWSRISEALARQGFALTEIYEPHERSKYVRFLGHPAAYVNGAGDRHDLFFWVHSRRTEPGPWRVHEVYVGLHVTFEASFKVLAATERYPKGSVLGAWFDLAEVQRLAASFPLLEEIDFTYGRIREPDSETVGWGFHVNASLVMDAKRGGRSVHYTAACGLDPRESRQGRRDWSGFTASEAVGPLTARGAGYWGAGLPAAGDD